MTTTFRSSRPEVRILYARVRDMGETGGTLEWVGGFVGPAGRLARQPRKMVRRPFTTIMEFEGMPAAACALCWSAPKRGTLMLEVEYPRTGVRANAFVDFAAAGRSPATWHLPMRQVIRPQIKVCIEDLHEMGACVSPALAQMAEAMLACWIQRNGLDLDAPAKEWPNGE